MKLDLRQLLLYFELSTIIGEMIEIGNTSWLQGQRWKECLAR
jgi:hypothetical protein